MGLNRNIMNRRRYILLLLLGPVFIGIVITIVAYTISKEFARALSSEVLMYYVLFCIPVINVLRMVYLKLTRKQILRSLISPFGWAILFRKDS